MSASITWDVQWMECYPTYQSQTDVVFQVGWVCYGSQMINGVRYASQQIGVCPVTYTSGSPYTPYNQLTENQVLGWVWSSGVNKTATEASIQASIDVQVNPSVVTLPLPWPTS